MSEEREPAFNPDAGEHVESAACRLLAMARERNAEVFCLFNDTRMTARPGMLLEEVLDGWSEGRRRTNETTPDAVTMLQRLHARAVDRENHGDVPRIGSDELLAVLRVTQAERARHAEEVAEFEGRISRLADCARNVADDRDSLRSLLPDVRACAEYCRNILIGPPGMPVEDYPLAPVALAARNILAALDSQGGEEPSLPGEPPNGNAGPARKDKSCSK